ncbi:MAG TPA: DUF4274 domain-containing protein [Polyangia bacterium]|nr:DUF4274 domain-containing protein [Polyangia bacterium]
MPTANVSKLVDRALPPTWQDELCRDIEARVRQEARGKGSKAWLSRFVAQVVTAIKPTLGPADAPRAELTALAARLIKAGRPEGEVGKQLDQRVDRLFAPIEKRILKVTEVRMKDAVAELALEDEAKRGHRFVLRYNWDDGVETLRELAEDAEACALGTALTIYWKARPHFYRQYRKRSELADYQRPTWDLLRLIERRIAANEYLHFGIVIDPRSQPGDYDWTRDVYAKLPRRVELPPQVWIRTTAAGVERIAPPAARKRRA